MAKMLGEGSATAGGKDWKLRFDMNTLADLEEMTGKPAQQVLKDMEDQNGKPMLARRLVCHAMLLHHHPEATIRDAGTILSEDTAAFAAVLKAALPDADVRAVGNVKAKAGRRL
jgi:hypothetical protein